MKKLTFAAAAAMMVAMLGTSCTKTQTTPTEPGKAMVTLNMELNTNEGNDTLSNGATTTSNGQTYTKWENNFPADFKVQFVVNSKDLQENPAGAPFVYDKLISYGTYADGKVTVELPAIAIPHNVDIMFPDLELTRTWRLAAGTAGVTAARDTTETRTYIHADMNFNIWDGAMIIKEHVTYAKRP